MKNKILTLLILILGVAIGVGATLLISAFLGKDKEKNEDETKYYEVLKDQKITIKNYNEEAYVVDNLNETVDVKISGNKKKVKKVIEQKEIEVVLDLNSVEPFKEVEVELTCEADGVICEVEPSKVTLTISKKISNIKNLNYEFLNEDSLVDLIVDSVTINRSEIIIKGSEEALKKVAVVKTLVDLDSKKDLKPGSYTFDGNLVRAYDKAGNIINNIEIVPSTVDATLKLIEIYSKEVPIKVNLVTPASQNKSIKLVSINGEKDFKVKIYGEKEDLEKINAIDVAIDAKGIKNEEKTYEITLTKPYNVKKMNVDSVEIVLKAE